MLKNLLIIFICSISLFALEIPKLEMNTDERPEIVTFTATSVLVNEKLSYKIKWNTIHASDVMLTFIGLVEPSGSLVITEDEYNRGPITLTASSKGSNYSDSKTINMGKKSDDPVVVFKHNENDENIRTYQRYRTLPYRRDLNPHRRYY